MTFQRTHRAQDHRARPLASSRGDHRRRRLRPEPGAAHLGGSVDRTSTSSCAARATITFRELLRALESSRRSRRHPRPVLSTAAGASSAIPIGRSAILARTCGRPIARRACSRATRSSAGRSTSSRRRAAARTTAASARSSRCAAATSTRGRSIASSRTSATRTARGARVDLSRRRQHHAERRAVQGPVPARSSTRALHDIDYIVQGMTSAIASSGDELASLMRAGRLPLRVPRHRERARSGSGVPAREGEERPARRRARRRQRDDARRRPAAPARHARRRRAHRREPGRHAPNRSKRISSSRAGTWTGPTSSIRRRIPGRR